MTRFDPTDSSNKPPANLGESSSHIPDKRIKMSDQVGQQALEKLVTQEGDSKDLSSRKLSNPLLNLRENVRD